MKCPKCGYLGFETTDRCRNCGYDFSLTAPAPVAELPLGSGGPDGTMVDLSLRGPGGAEPAAPDAGSRLDLDEFVGAPTRAPGAPGRHGADEAAGPEGPDAEELPLFAPRPAGTPLAVRRPGADVPRAKRTTTTRPRPTTPSLPLVSESRPKEPLVPPPSRRVVRSEVASFGARLGAGVVDLGLLASIDLVVVWLTLRIAGLQATVEDLQVLRPLPLAGFFLVLAFLYLVGFTLGCGQTIGQMVLGIRVIGDDEQGVDLTGAVVRALGVLASACALGLLFIPALFAADRRAVYDRLAGTRVVAG